MRQVEGVRLQSRVPSIGANDLNITECPCRDKVGCHRDVRRVAVQTDNAAAWRDTLGQQLDDASRSAADVDCSVAGMQPYPI
jgi:hypothetical protein